MAERTMSDIEDHHQELFDKVMHTLAEGLEKALPDSKSRDETLVNVSTTISSLILTVGCVLSHIPACERAEIDEFTTSTFTGMMEDLKHIRNELDLQNISTPSKETHRWKP